LTLVWSAENKNGGSHVNLLEARWKICRKEWNTT